MANISVSVTPHNINIEEVSSTAAAKEHGAVNIFFGFVRNRNLGRDVVAVEYECHSEVCVRTIEQIAAEASHKWAPDANILIIHRYGRLLVGEASVAILATTGHRDESYKITRYIIEEIKLRAPIWKKEFYLDGETEWVKGHALCQHKRVNHNENSGNSSGGR
ncbi:MAG: molybdenum cofactor biosynthesis protein MoaE [Oligoflexia bacterium]|nr:molybdenum cofactor biosynthesis protein MoaE [Oligoflexia bacterium]